MYTLGFAGTAKNTGKTTTALRVLAQAAEAGLRVALTSIGYDGETIDNVTGLPKPRYFQRPGMLLATAQTCLKTCSAGIRILDVTPIRTILGPVVLAEITEPGSVVLAGPNRNTDLKAIYRLLAGYGADLTIVDGALNRLVPLEGAGGLVLSTGAAFDENIADTAAHAGALTGLFSFPATTPAALSGGIQIFYPGRDPLTLPTGSLLSGETLAQIRSALIQPAAVLSIPGACSPALFVDLLASTRDNLESAAFIFGSPLKLAASGDPLLWSKAFSLLRARGQTITYQHTLPLRLVTINPFFPRYLSSGRYEPAHVDKSALLAAVRAAVTSVPVINIQTPPLPNLLPLLGLAQKETHNA